MSLVYRKSARGSYLVEGIAAIVVVADVRTKAAASESGPLQLGIIRP